MERILVTTDFSGNSKAGIRFGIQLASQTKAEITFLHVVEILKPTSWNNRKFKHFADLKKEEMGKKLVDFIALVCRQNGLKPRGFRYSVELDMDVDRQVIRSAKKYKA